MAQGSGDALLDQLRERLAPAHWPLPLARLPGGTALVGGAVRDGLLNRLQEQPDLDLVVPTDAIALTKALARGAPWHLCGVGRGTEHCSAGAWGLDGRHRPTGRCSHRRRPLAARLPPQCHRRVTPALGRAVGPHRTD